MENDIEEKILKLLSQHPEGITINDISRFLNIHRNTASKYVYGLLKSDNLERRQIGMAYLYYIKKVEK
jgi:DNA-binding IclR family transcriptional regulator